MMILLWFAVCIIFAFVNKFLGDSVHALELFAFLSAVVFFLINKFKNKIRLTK
mgnify:CR=1 FL=1|tara:strand:+ start:1057 stop:1215 length:159 start_codon:yes stop_codon:yes gene_type:complete